MTRTAARARHGRWFDLIATVAIGVVVVGAALVPAVTANSGEVVTVRGDVTLAGRPLAFFPVGFWTTEGVVASSRTVTNASGEFTVDVPAVLSGYLYAGTTPDDDHAIASVDGRSVVRGLVGNRVPAGVSTPLYQGWPLATGRSLSTSRVHLRLESPGRISGTSPVTGASVRAVQVRRLDGSVVQNLRLDARGRYTSGQLVPGDYLIALVPAAPLLPTSAAVTVRAGSTVSASPPVPLTGAEVDGRVTIGGRAAGAGVPVQLLQGTTVTASTTTAAGGTYRFSGVGPGAYEVRVGVFPDDDPSAPASATAVPLPSASSTPTPTPTPTPSATPSVDAVPAPVERTIDAGVPASTSISVPSSLGSVSVTTDLLQAGRLGGVVRGTGGSPARVVVEEVATDRVVRGITVGADGRWTVGGLQQGTAYRVWAVTEPDDSTLARMGESTAVAATATSGTDVSIDRSAITLQGTVAGATSGTVSFGDEQVFARSSAVDDSGAYVLQGLVPGVFAMSVTVPDRLRSTPVAVTLTAPSRSPDADDEPVELQQDLQPGPQPATFTGWFIASGAGVPIVSGTATSTTGEAARLGPRTDAGHVTIEGLAPGTYAYDEDSFASTVPTLDGPWWYTAPTGTFVLRDGLTTDVGPVLLHARDR